MRATPLWLARNAFSIVGQSWPSAVIPPRPVTTTRFTDPFIEPSNHSAIDADDLARDVRRIVRHQKIDYRCDFAGFSDPSQGHRLEHLLDRRVVHHVGPDQARGDAIHGD